METTAGTHAYELSAQPERSLSQRVLVDLFALARSEGELKLIEAELRASAGVRAGLSFGLASIFASVASAGIGAAFVAGLSRVVPLWTAALGAAVVFAVPALALAGRGREALARASVPMGSPGASDAAARAQAAQAEVERTMAALTAKVSNPSPVRDAVQTEMALTVAALYQAARGAR